MSLSSPIVKAFTLLLFISCIIFFVTCRTGFFDKKNKKPKEEMDIMSGSKSSRGGIIDPRIDTTPKEIDIMVGSKSAIMFEPDEAIEIDSTKNLMLDSLVLDSLKKTLDEERIIIPGSKSGAIIPPRKVEKEKVIIPSSKSGPIVLPRIDSLPIEKPKK